MTEDEEADLIIDRLRRTDKERQEEKEDELSNIMMQCIREEIDAELRVVFAGITNLTKGKV